MTKQFVTFCRADEIGPGEREVFDLDALSIVIFNVDGRYYAVENQCSHQEVALEDGHLDGTVLQCTAHGAHFDLTNGEPLSAPAYTPVQIFPVRVENGELQVELAVS